MIAEIGVNHNGNYKLAQKTIKAAVDAGADAVKFQMFDTDEFMSNSGEIYKYRTQFGYKTEKMHAMFKRLEFNYSWYSKLKKFCNKLKIDIFSTAGNEFSADFLEKNNCKILKIASPDLTNTPLLKHVAKKKLLTIVSTGMGDEEEIDAAVEIFKKKNCPLILLHCVSMYPTPLSQANISRIITLRKRYSNVPIGYSDHTESYQSAIVAVTMGAKVLEKHFTLKKSLIGPDHQISSNPKELKEYIKEVKQVRFLIGSGLIKPSYEEKKNRKLFRRSITARKKIKAGDKFNLNNLTLRRPENGLHPKFLDKILGKKSNRLVNEDQKIKFSFLAKK